MPSMLITAPIALIIALTLAFGPTELPARLKFENGVHLFGR